MSELKVGGLALVIGLKDFAHLNGKCVHLYLNVNQGEVFKSPVSEQLFMNGANTKSWIATGDITNSTGEYGWGKFSPKNLLPIDGDDFSDELKSDKEKEHA